MAPPPSLLPVIQVVTDANGLMIGPAEELRIAGGLVASLITGDGPSRVEVAVEGHGGEHRPLLAFVPFLPQGAMERPDVVLVCADTEAPSEYGSIEVYSFGAVASSHDNYKTLDVIDVDPGSGGASTVCSFTTRPTSDGGTGPWIARYIAFTIPGGELAAGHVLVGTWGYEGVGVALPGGCYRRRPV